MKNPQELLVDLERFGEETVWFQPLLYTQFLYTNGVRYLATHARCFWLLDLIFSNQVLRSIDATDFQVWTITKDGNKAVIKVDDGNDTIIETFTLINTCFPF